MRCRLYASNVNPAVHILCIMETTVYLEFELTLSIGFIKNTDLTRFWQLVPWLFSHRREGVREESTKINAFPFLAITIEMKPRKMYLWQSIPVHRTRHFISFHLI